MQVVTLVLGALGAVVVAAVTRRWWRRRGADVAASERMAMLAIAATTLLIPALVLASGGLGVALWWVLVIPVAWFLAGAASVIEQHEARARDVSLGAPERPLLWSPWVVAVVTFLAVDVVMVCWLLLWGVVTGDVDTSEITAVGGAAVCAIVALPLTQFLRRTRAGGGLPLLQTVEQLRHRRAVAAAAAVVGSAAVLAGVVWAATLTPVRTEAHTAYAMIAPAPGWVLLGLAWLAARPQPPISGAAPSA